MIDARLKWILHSLADKNKPHALESKKKKKKNPKLKHTNSQPLSLDEPEPACGQTHDQLHEGACQKTSRQP
jgi:hypothetical protein